MQTTGKTYVPLLPKMYLSGSARNGPTVIIADRVTRAAENLLGETYTNELRRTAVKTLVVTTLILITVYFQVSPVAADYSQCSRVGYKVIQGTEDYPGSIPAIDADDGFCWIVSGAQTGTVPRLLTTIPSSVNTIAGYPWGGNLLSYLQTRDNVNWNITSAGGAGDYYPNVYMPIDQTTWKSGSLANLTSNDNKYMTLESYPTCGQYGLRFNGTYYMDAGNGPSLNITGSFTAEFRIKWNVKPPNGDNTYILGKFNAGNGFQVFYSYTNTSDSFSIRATIARNYQLQTSFSSNSPLTLGTWYHIVFINDNGRHLFYVNGINKGNVSYTVNPGSTSEHLWIGGSAPSYWNYTLKYATLDEVAIWNCSKWTGSSFTVPTSAYLGDEPNLCGLWHLDEGFGSVAYDSSPNSNDGTASQTPDWVVGYRFVSNPSYAEQYGARFDGSNLISVGDYGCLNFANSPFTMEVRLLLYKGYTSATKTAPIPIIDKAGSEDKGYRMYMVLWCSGGTLFAEIDAQLYSSDPKQHISFSFNPLLRTWYHIAWVYEKSSKTHALYLDGTRKTYATDASAAESTGDSFRIAGHQGPAYGNYFTLDEVAVWNSSKWTGSSFTVPTSPYIGNEANLCGLWHLNEWSGTAAHDSSLNHHDGTWSGTPDWVGGYPFVSAQMMGVVFSGTSNLLQWSSLTWTTDLGWTVGNVSVSIQLFNYTLGRYVSSGSGNLAYWSSAVPNVDEMKSQTININSQQFRDPTTGKWKMKIIGWKSTASSFQIKCDLVDYCSNAPGADVEFISTLPDNNIRTGVAKLNVTVVSKCNVTSLVQNFYLFNFLSSSYQLRNSSTFGKTYKTVTVNMTSGAADYISPAGQVKIKINSTSAGVYVACFDLVKWDLNYNEPKWEIQWRVDYQTTVSRSAITKLAVKLRGNISRTAEIAYASMYNCSDSSWTRVIQNTNHTSMQTQWYNTTSSTDINRFITSNGYLNVSMYVRDTNWTAIKSYTDNLAIYINSLTPDSTPPAIITDLTAGNPTASSITLTWTAPGDDGSTGTATGYLVKYSTMGAINSSNWNSATNYTQSWAPLPGGSQETHVVSGLQSGTRYWFAIKAYDEVPNYSGVSNSPSASTTDITPPAPVNDLNAKSPTGNTITLTWTAVGDDGSVGTASGYWVKYSTTGAITDVNWSSATDYIQSWIPLPAGSNETRTVTGLNSGTKYWFAIEAFDETPNYGGASNSASASTVDTTPPAAITDLRASNATIDSVTLTWTATGDDGDSGTATGYVVKYSTVGPITASNWDSATEYAESWVPLASGSTEVCVVSGLQSDSQYWFAVRAYDEVPNYGGCSNSPSAPTRDTVPPSAITNLAVSSPATDSITLTWTAPNDGIGVTVVGYAVKFSASGPITDENWDSALTYVQSWVPLTPGSVESHVIYGLNSSTKYWFAVKAYDETPNYSVASNSPDGTTSASQAGGGGSLNSILIIVIPVALIAVSSIGVVGLKVMGRSRQVGPKSPFRKRSKTLEGVARPKLREYVGESGVVPQPKKKAKFEEESGAEGNEKK